MRTKIRKWFWAWSFEKEEKWLSEMSAKGFQLVSVGFFTYHFEKGTPGEYTVRLEMLDHWPTHPESRQYIEFLEDTDAEHVGSIARWVYFRRKKELGEFDLFSDIDSRIKHLGRIMILCLAACLINFANGLNNLSRYFMNGLTFSLVVAGLCIFVSAAIGAGYFSLLKKQRRLKRERTLRE